MANLSLAAINNSWKSLTLLNRKFVDPLLRRPTTDQCQINDYLESQKNCCDIKYKKKLKNFFQFRLPISAI